MAVQTAGDRPAMTDTKWRTEATCRGVNPALFYDEHPAGIAAAKHVCARCPVRAACLAHAVETGEEYGVWGAMSAAERLGRAAPGGPGRPKRLTDSELAALFADADPELPALDQLVAAAPMSLATAYRTLDRALQLELVERRDRTMYPANR